MAAQKQGKVHLSPLLGSVSLSIRTLLPDLFHCHKLIPQTRSTFSRRNETKLTSDARAGAGVDGIISVMIRARPCSSLCFWGEHLETFWSAGVFQVRSLALSQASTDTHRIRAIYLLGSICFPPPAGLYTRLNIFGSVVGSGSGYGSPFFCSPPFVLFWYQTDPVVWLYLRAGHALRPPRRWPLL